MEPRLNEHSENEFYKNHKFTTIHNQYHKPNPGYLTSYTRLPHLLRNTNPLFPQSSRSETIRSLIANNFPIRHQVPQFENLCASVQNSLVTKTESHLTMHSNLPDCCQT